MGKDFIQLTGNDDNAFEFNKRGGVGAIGVTANIAAKLSSDFQNACVNDISKAKELFAWQPKVQRHEGMKKTLDYFKTLSKQELNKTEHRDFNKHNNN